jgi:hypothetical protein
MVEQACRHTKRVTSKLPSVNFVLIPSGKTSIIRYSKILGVMIKKAIKTISSGISITTFSTEDK